MLAGFLRGWSGARTLTAGLMATPATAAVGCTVNVSCVAATATRKSVADSGLFANGTHALARAVWSTARDRQWYAVLSLNPATAAGAAGPVRTRGAGPCAR